MGESQSTSSTPLFRLSEIETQFTGASGAVKQPTVTVPMAGSTPMTIVPWAAPGLCSRSVSQTISACTRYGARLAQLDQPHLPLFWFTAGNRSPRSDFFLLLTTLLLSAALQPLLTRRLEDASLSVLPVTGVGEKTQLQQFDVYIAHYPTFSPIQSNGDALARLLAQQLPNQRLVVVAHSMEEAAL